MAAELSPLPIDTEGIRSLVEKAKPTGVCNRDGLVDVRVHLSEIKAKGGGTLTRSNSQSPSERPCAMAAEGIRSLVRAEVTVSEEPQGSAGAGAGEWLASRGCEEGPWFFLITPPFEEDGRDGPGTVVAFHFGPLKHSPAKIHRQPVPKPFELYRLLNPLPRSGEGGGHYLLIQNQGKPRGTIHIVDPFSSSWKSISTLPGSVDHPSETIFAILKVVTRNHDIAPGTPVVAITRPSRLLFWTTVGPSSHQWRSLKKNVCLADSLAKHFSKMKSSKLLMASLNALGKHFSDLIWCARHRCFWALLGGVDQVISFDIDGTSDAVGAEKMILQPSRGFDNYDNEYMRNALFVDAPSGLFIVRWEKLAKQGLPVKRHLDVHKLLVNGNKKKWKPVTSLDNHSFFLGSNNSLALSPDDFPGLRSNRIYLPFNGRYPEHDTLQDLGHQVFLEDLPLNWIYNLDDKSWEPCPGEDRASKEPFNHCPVAWVMPHTIIGKDIQLTPEGISCQL